MNKIRYSLLFLAFITLLSNITLSSCNKTLKTDNDKRIIALNIGFDYDSADYSGKLDTLETVTEISSNIILCEIIKQTKTQITQTNALNFQYEVKIEDIYFNNNELINIEDIITISSAAGIIKGENFKELVENSPHAQKFGYVDKEFAENEYVVSSNYNTLPIEIGKKYIIFLTDRYYEQEGVFAETGHGFLYEYTDENVYYGYNKNENSENLYDKSTSKNEIEENINKAINDRTNRADEIGYLEYIDELGESQAANH